MIAEALEAAVVREELLGHLSKLLNNVPGVEVGSSRERGGKVWEFIVTVPDVPEAQATIAALERLTADR